MLYVLENKKILQFVDAIIFSAMLLIDTQT